METCKPVYYSQDVIHGKDFAFGIKEMRLYIARANTIVSRLSNY